MRIRRESWEEIPKTEMMRNGKGEKETLAVKQRDFEKLRLPTNGGFDWCGVGSVN